MTEATRTRRLQARAEATDRTAKEGRFTALTSTTGVDYPVDSMGNREVIEPGAFRNIENPIAVYHSHAHKDTHRPPIGVGEGRETSDGLVVDGRLFLGQSEDARTTFAALESGALREWSIGFRPVETREDDKDPKLTHVLEADVLEVSAVLKGANPETETIMVRSAGRTLDLSKRRERERAGWKCAEILRQMTWPAPMRERVFYALEHSDEFRRLYLKARENGRKVDV